MILVVFDVERDKGGSYSKVDEFQAKVDAILGLCGKFSCKVSHRFSDCCEFDTWVHIGSG